MSLHDHDEELRPDERWLVSYADMMTLLFGFFVLLFASASQDQGMEKMKSELSKQFSAQAAPAPSPIPSPAPDPEKAKNGQPSTIGALFALTAAGRQPAVMEWNQLSPSLARVKFSESEPKNGIQQVQYELTGITSDPRRAVTLKLAGVRTCQNTPNGCRGEFRSEISY